ncbi:hypothetical protein EPA93_32860 [Ktedonosporobacter rubrisoli]|uniref:Uncharacterized protein n=1 Tax=Ktedonosporobacter rubrisoli TaxID=2509675 RepID=A0A4P6JXM4_KTERU|nr:hypothetical protein [Ktedonosporobacter rubrisoli]QBD80509.1 hypothetical protein EPA93_32860 [Ktedonosporobacter rubrisoli]
MGTQYPDPPRETRGPQEEMSNSMKYFIGLGIGLVPLIMGLLSLRFIQINLPLLTLYAYLAIVVASIVLLFFRKVRYIGYGLLTMVAVSPVVMAIACTVMFSQMG